MVNDIEKYRYDLELIHETAGQVIRDFDLFSVNITFSGNPMTAYNELHSQLVPALRQLDKTAPGRLNSLLYRIDVPESEVTEIPYRQGVEEYYSALAERILRRELLKVAFRKLFSRGNG